MMPERCLRVFPSLLGAFFGLALLKFGNPPIMEKWVEAPGNIYEILLGSPWPITWAYAGLGALILSALPTVWHKGFGRLQVPAWLMLLPIIWLLWQVLATYQSLDRDLSWPTLRHFAACVVCFYFGLLVLSRADRLNSLWPGLVCGFLLVLATGWQQHFGGLAATREFFFREIYPRLKEVPPEYLKKMSSTRIFGTLFYPNALAGAIILFLPAVLAVTAQAKGSFTLAARRFLVLVIGVASLGCLYWSGSKGGWLLCLLLALIALLRVQFSKSLKILLVAVVLTFGLSGFVWKYAGFFRKGATSVGARFDYWEAALKTAASNPWTGTGPGTFMIPYREIKRPESEMTRMVHNDYLEQASDSGWIGFLTYAGFITAGVFVSGRRCFPRSGLKPSNGESPGWTDLCLWLGLLGWCLQGLFEFGLYIPALAWPAFAFLGLLLGRGPNRIDKPSPRL